MKSDPKTTEYTEAVLCGGLPQHLRGFGYPLCDRAADEIERLRGAPKDTRQHGAGSRAELRQQIIDRLHELVLPKKIERLPRPSLDELEKILNSVDPPNIQIGPDGSIVEYRPQTTTVGVVADAILDLLGIADAEVVSDA